MVGRAITIEIAIQKRSNLKCTKPIVNTAKTDNFCYCKVPRAITILDEPISFSPIVQSAKILLLPSKCEIMFVTL